MSDLVERLREESLWLQQTAWKRLDGGQQCCMSSALADEAADRITQIERELADARRQPEGLSKWAGLDQSNMPWTEAKHKDRVCYAAFGETWSMEDAHALISFIDRTWGAKAQPHSETRQEQR